MLGAKSKMAMAPSFNYSGFLKDFHSVIFEEMANIEAVNVGLNNSDSGKVAKESFHRAYMELFKPFIEGIKLPLQENTQLSDTSGLDLTTNDDGYTSKVENPCHLITDEESSSYQNIAFQLELVVQPIFILIGVIFNTIAIKVLQSHNDPKLNNIFNGLLVWLAIFDNCFMITCLVENTWRHFGVSWHYTFDIGYCFMLYPFKNFALTCITNTQVALSIERFKAIIHPIEYHRNNTNKKSRSHIINGYIGTVAIAALIFCIPKFFESKVIGITEKKLTLDTVSNISEMINHTQYKVDFSDLRFNRYYVLVYNIAIKQLVTAFIPFILIVAFNINTFVTIHRRQKLSPRLRNSRSQSINHQAARQSYVLFAILVVFGFCHIPRFILALNEFTTLDLIQKSLTNECRVVKFWILVFGSVSQTLLSFNSSINFLLYPAISKDFRHICKVYFKTKFPIIEKLIAKNQTNEQYTGEDVEVGSRILARPQSTELLQSGNLLAQDNMNREIFVLEEISTHTHQDIVAVYQEGNGDVVTSSSRRSSILNLDGTKSTNSSFISMLSSSQTNLQNRNVCDMKPDQAHDAYLPVPETAPFLSNSNVENGHIIT